MKLFARSIVAMVMVLLVSCAWAAPRVGAPAPDLRFDKLLQAPAGTRVDWPSLKGKTVVLEFWATWCAPCVEAIPHLSELAASVDPKKVVFISVDDEPSSVIEGFLKKKQIGGWVALDFARNTFRAFGVEARPATVVIDGSGRIAAFTTVDKLNPIDLVALADKKVSSSLSRRQNASATAPQTVKPAGLEVGSGRLDETKPLFELVIREGAPGEQMAFVHDSEGTFSSWRGIPLEFLLRRAYGVPLRRFSNLPPLSDHRYDLTLRLAGVRHDLADLMIQSAVCSGLGLAVTKTEITQRALVMKRTSRTDGLLIHAGSITTPQGVRYQQGKLLFVNSSFGQIAAALEDRLDLPVVDETGLTDTYDGELTFTSIDMENVKAALSRSLGIDLLVTERPITNYSIRQTAVESPTTLN